MTTAKKKSLNRTQLPRDFGVAIALLLSIAGFVGCAAKPADDKAPPPDVTVAHPVVKDVVEWDVYTGHLMAPETANVAARVSGLIMSMPFEEGAIVKRGDLLAVIDDRPFKADLDSKQADQQRAESALAIANITLDRLSALRKNNAVAQQDLDNGKAVSEQAQAAVASAKAAVELSRLNLGWCRVLSPIDGRVSYKLVTVGNLVNGGAGQATLLTTVESVSPVYCYVDVDEHSVLKYQKLAEQRKLISVRDGKMPCYLELGNESGFPHEGVIDFVDNHVDRTTGTMRVRGVLENKSGLLVPGFFARLRIPGSGRYQAMLVPDTAIGKDQSEYNVMVVDNDSKVSARPVKLGAAFGGFRAIVSGIKVDDRVVTNGQMHAMPGSPVTATEVPIKLDDGAFSDPGSTVARETGETGGSSADSANGPLIVPVSATQAVTGLR